MARFSRYSGAGKKAMKNLYKTIILPLVFLSSSATLSATKDDVLRANAEKFVRQIREKDSRAILQTYPMTGIFTALYTCRTHRNAIGLMAGPSSLQIPLKTKSKTAKYA